MSDVTIVNGVFTERGAGNVFPLATLLIVSALETAGFEVDFFDYQLYPQTASQASKAFIVFSPLSLASGLASISIAPICDHAGRPPTFQGRASRKDDHSRGPSATDTPVEIMENFPADIIVRGEGEVTIVDLMRALEDGRDLSLVEGITYRGPDGAIHSNSPRPRVTDWTHYPVQLITAFAGQTMDI